MQYDINHFNLEIYNIQLFFDKNDIKSFKQSTSRSCMAL